jgi:hypothetical protein
MLVEAGATVGGPGPGPAAHATAAAAADPGFGSGVLEASAGAEHVSEPAGRIREAFAAVRDGFAQATGEVGDDVGEGLRDSRLMMQIGMLLGCVYVAFLSIWFWATRLRGLGRRGDYVR